jgi:hypothetical protein
MNERMNEWMNEWMNGYIETYTFIMSRVNEFSAPERPDDEILYGATQNLCVLRVRLCSSHPSTS